MNDYADFLRQKIKLASFDGFPGPGALPARGRTRIHDAVAVRRAGNGGRVMLSFSPTTPTLEIGPASTIGAGPCSDRGSLDVTGVGQNRLSRSELRDLPDAALSEYIGLCIERQHQAHARWLANGDMADAGERDHWMLAEHEARDHRTVRAELNRGRE